MEGDASTPNSVRSDGGNTHQSPRAKRYLRRRSSPSRDLVRTAIEVAEILAHLVEREPQSENAFQGVYRQTLRQPVAAYRCDGLGVVVKRGFDRLQRRRREATSQRFSFSTQLIS